MDLTDELEIMIEVLERIPGEQLGTFHDREMSKHYDAIYKIVGNAPRRLKLKEGESGTFPAKGVELLTKAKALYAFLQPLQRENAQGE